VSKVAKSNWSAINHAAVERSSSMSQLDFWGIDGVSCQPIEGKFQWFGNHEIKQSNQIVGDEFVGKAIRLTSIFFAK